MKYKKQVWIVILLAMMLGGIIFYLTLLQGRTFGPDFITSVQRGEMQFKDVKSIEVIEPPLGYMPFTQAEYDALTRSLIIDDPPKIKKFIQEISLSEPCGWIHQNHPGTIYSIYCKINLVNSGFHYLYIKLLKDNAGEVFYVESNSKNATNPNGAKLFRIINFSPFFGLLKTHANQ
jgi:hypothetical protein